MKALVECILTVLLATSIVITMSGCLFVLRVVIYQFHGLDIEKKYNELFDKLKKKCPYKDDFKRK